MLPPLNTICALLALRLDRSIVLPPEHVTVKWLTVPVMVRWLPPDRSVEKLLVEENPVAVTVVPPDSCRLSRVGMEIVAFRVVVW